MSSGQKRIKRSITTHDKTSSTGSKKVFDPQMQSFTKRMRRLQSSIHHNVSKHKKLTIDTLCEKIITALDHYYSDDETGFYTDCREFLSRGIDSWKQKIVDRMNTYEYVQMAIGHKPFTDIQTEIIKQWRKNYLLFAIMTFWYSSIQKSHFISLKQFKSKYDICRDFISQISYLIFKSWLNNWQKRMEKNNISALNKLFDQTSHFVITQSSEFKRVYQKIMLPLIQRQLIGTTIHWQYDLNQLTTKKCVFDLRNQQNLLKTIESLKKFTKQIKLSKKLQLLREYRLTLQQQINTQQQHIQQQQGHTNSQVLQKDDFISALVYCTIKGHLQQIRYTLLYMITLLGEQLSILSKLKIKVYFDDLFAVSDFLTVHKLQQNEQKQLQKLKNLAINRRMKIVSSPLLENNDSSQYAQDSFMNDNIKQLVSVKNMTQVEQKQNQSLSTVLLLSSPNFMQV